MHICPLHIFYSRASTQYLLILERLSDAWAIHILPILKAHLQSYLLCEVFPYHPRKCKVLFSMFPQNYKASLFSFSAYYLLPGIKCYSVNIYCVHMSFSAERQVLFLLPPSRKRYQFDLLAFMTLRAADSLACKPLHVGGHRLRV